MDFRQKIRKDWPEHRLLPDHDDNYMVNMITGYLLD